MNEIKFLHKNTPKWEEFEKLINQGYQPNPDKLSELYITLTDDLAYSRTFFPNSKTTIYLNQLTQKAHGIIYKNKPTSKKGIVNFWGAEFPLLIYNTRKEIFISFLILFVSVLIGIISFQHDVRFARVIMGDSYVNMTLANIEKGDPLAVYKSMNQVEMFLGITVNNIKVSFLAFVFGLFTSLGSGFLLLRNGIMLGTFHAFFAKHGILFDSILTIWIHGTFEIFAIIVAGGAGIVMGNSLIFPGTYARGVSFRQGAMKGAKMVLGLVPVFVVAGFLEGFVTRYTNTPYPIRISIILISLLTIFFYFYLYPKRILTRNNHGTNTN